MLIQDLQVILKVAEFRSITQAANNLDMRIATASAAIKRVETSLGTELFVRTTRKLRLSAAGERYLPQCQQAIQMLEQARHNLSHHQDRLEGEIRLSISSDLGRNLAVPWLDEFMQAHPGIGLKLDVSDSNIDFYRDPVDMALRYGSPQDASVYGFKICDVPRLFCASPDYIARHSCPQDPQELTQHNGLFYQLHDLIHNVWHYTDQGRRCKIKMNGNRASNDADLVRRWCVAGQGIAPNPVWIWLRICYPVILKVFCPTIGRSPPSYG